MFKHLKIGVRFGLQINKYKVFRDIKYRQTFNNVINLFYSKVYETTV